MDHSASFISAKNKSLKVIVMFIAALMTFLVMTEGFSADAAAAKLSTPKMTAQINYGSCSLKTCNSAVRVLDCLVFLPALIFATLDV